MWSHNNCKRYLFIWKPTGSYKSQITFRWPHFPWKVYVLKPSKKTCLSQSDGLGTHSGYCDRAQCWPWSFHHHPVPEKSAQFMKAQSRLIRPMENRQWSCPKTSSEVNEALWATLGWKHHSVYKSDRRQFFFFRYLQDSGINQKSYKYFLNQSSMKKLKLRLIKGFAQGHKQIVTDLGLQLGPLPA